MIFASVKLSDVQKTGNLSAEFHINRLLNRNPYVLKEGKYVPAKKSEIRIATYMKDSQVDRINELLGKVAGLQGEIEKIKSEKPTP